MTIEQVPTGCNVDTDAATGSARPAIRIRPARREDMEAVTPLILSAGPDAFRYVFANGRGISPERFIARAFAARGGGMSWRLHRVVEVAGEVVAVAACFRGARALAFTPADLAHIVASFGIGATPGIVIRGLKLGQIIEVPIHWRTAYIANVAVAPAFRGREIGARLLQHLHEEARAMGMARCMLDVSMENPRAEALYARLGYRVVRERTSALRNAAGHVPGHRRMVLEL